MYRVRRNWLLAAAVLAASVAGRAQEAPGQALPRIVKGNEQFGRRLLHQVHSASPGGNVVTAPLSLSIFLAALQDQSNDAEAREQIGAAFGWGPYPALRVPARMLMVAFEQPELALTRPRAAGKRPRSQEGAWITNTFAYSTPSSGAQPISPDFVRDAEKYFGVKFVNTGTAKPTPADLTQAEGLSSELPQVNGGNDVLVRSGAHLETIWLRNTFSMSEPYPVTFHTASGESRQVTAITSQLAVYGHGKTATFEAVALPCRSGYFVAVLPAEGVSVDELERELVERPDELDAALQPQVGRVTLPMFHLRFESDLSASIQALGMRKLFTDVGAIIKIPGSHLTRITQKTDIEVNRDGIRADAEQVIGIVYAGKAVGPEPFHVHLNRPFLFLIREHDTNALMFIGAVMDPTRN